MIFFPPSVLEDKALLVQTEVIQFIQVEYFDLDADIIWPFINA